MSANVPDKIRSNCFGKVRTACHDKQTQRGTTSLFSMVTARQPLWGYGTFSGANSTLYAVGGSYISPGGESQGPGTGVAWSYNPVWPAVYNTLTEKWEEVYLGGAPLQPGGYTGGTKSTTTPYSQYADVVYSSSSTGISVVGEGTITAFTVTNTLITISYAFSQAQNPANPIAYSNFGGVYTASLSGSLLNPSGTGPFNPSDPTYGWAALTALANALLAISSIPTISGSSTWTTIDPISTSPGYRISSNTYNSATLWDDIFAAAYGFPTSPSFCQTQFIPPSIMDWPVPSTNGQPSGAYLNQGASMCAKSKWNLNGAGWGNTSIDPGINDPPPTGLSQIMNDHATLFAQSIDLTNFNAVGSVKSATTFPNPINWPTTFTFNPSDVTANIGSGDYGLLGFQSAPR